MTRTTLIGISLLALGACTPRPPLAPPTPVALPPAPAPEPDAESRARTSWEGATLLGRQGRWAEAETRLREAVRLDSTEVTYHLALAGALVQLGHHTRAADAMLDAIRLEEASPRPNHRVLIVDYDRLIEMLERVNRLDEARHARIRQDEHRRRRDQQN